MSVINICPKLEIDERKVIKSSQSMRCPFNHGNYHEVFTSQPIKGEDYLYFTGVAHC